MRLCICIDVYRLFWTTWPQWPIFNLLFESLWKVMRASERKGKNCCLFCIQEFNTIHCILWLWWLTRYNMVSFLIFTSPLQFSFIPFHYSLFQSEVYWLSHENQMILRENHSLFPKKIADRYFAGNRTFRIESVETFNLKAWKCHKLLFWIQFE